MSNNNETVNYAGRLGLALFKSAEFDMLRNSISGIQELLDKDPESRIYLNFTVLNFFSISTILIYRAWVEEIHKKFPRAKLFGRYNIDDPRNELFEAFGYFDILPPMNFSIDQLHSKGSNLKCKFFDEISYRNMSNAEPRLAFEIAELMFGDNKDIPPNHHQLGASINEALHNIRNWAYESYNDISMSRWWMTGLFNQETKKLNILIYDMGVGIPERFSKHRLGNIGLMSKVLDVDKEASDSQFLLAAMKLNAKNARQLIPDGRCRGLQQMRQMTIGFETASMSIRSGRGQYHMLCSKGKITNCSADPAPSIVKKGPNEPTTSFIPGTLIMWSLGL